MSRDKTQPNCLNTELIRYLVIHCSLVVDKYAMAVLFPFEYSIDPKDHKFQEDIKAIAVEGAIWPKTLTGCQGLAGSALQDGGVPPEH